MVNLNRIFLIIILLLSFLSGCHDKPLYKDTRLLMGTFIEVTSINREAAAIVFREIGNIENLLSKYKPESDIAKLNKLGKLKVDPRTFFIIKQAKEFCCLSDGAFDITVGPLLELWGFREKKYRLPDQNEITRALSLVGSDKIILHEGKDMVEFKIPLMQIDLGAIAKGYALDYAVIRLKERGIENCLINAGGQVYCLGNNFGQPWKVAIRHPRKANASGYLELSDKSVATSGDYEQYFLKDNRRYSHIFNPKTGYPAASGIISVSVIAPSALTADVLSTAIFVLGKEKGLKLARQFPEVEVSIIEASD